MKVKKKLLLALSLLAILPMLVSVTVSTWVAGDSANSLLVKQAQQQLATIRDTKKQSVQNYIEQTRKLLTSFSQSKLAGELLDEMEYGALEYPEQNNKVSVKESRLKLLEYFQNNPLPGQFSASAHVDGLPNFAAVMQYRYIATNEFPADERHMLIYSKDYSIYSEAHRRYQQETIDYMASNNIYDIYLVNFEGVVLYTARKEADFGTSLRDGPFGQTALGQFFQQLESTDYKGDVPLNTDFIAYQPSGDLRTMFMGTLVKQHGLPLGIVIFQLTSNGIDSIMTNNRDWQSAGLGNTGETYLVGADSSMRSIDRLLAENPQKYFTELEASNTDQATVESIRVSGQSINRQRVDTLPVQLAHGGESGFEVFEKPDGTKFLSAYAPLGIDSFDWVILAEMEEQEANAPSIALSKRILILSAAAAIIVAIIAVLMGWLFTARLVRPIEKLASEIDHIESNSDLTFTLSGKTTDVTIDIVTSMNKLLRTLHAIVSTVAGSSEQLLKSAHNIDQISDRSYTDIQKQGVETNNITEAISGVIESVSQTDNDAADANQAAKTASDCVATGREIVDATTRSVSKLDGEVKRASDIINNLAQSSDDVGNVLGVISSIAEQTNLLALNAAIEAARAGEQGRGFAVVADEVRTLASRTQDSTEEVRNIVGALQSYAKEAVDAMDSGLEQGNKSVERTHKTSEALQEIVESIGTLAAFNDKIAAASNQQRLASEQVSNRISVIGEITETTTDGAQQTRHASDEINTLASQLNQAVSTFKL